jgi:hypothetical protein
MVKARFMCCNSCEMIKSNFISVQVIKSIIYLRHQLLNLGYPFQSLCVIRMCYNCKMIQTFTQGTNDGTAQGARKAFAMPE